MRKVFLTLLILATIFTCLACPSLASAKYSGGTGDPNDPYQIATCSDLIAIGTDINDFNKCFIMTADINFAQYPYWARIGKDAQNPFTGIFDGNGHSISNFKYVLSLDYIGLFGYVSSGGVIKNLVLIKPYIKAQCAGMLVHDVGSLVGHLGDGVVENCSAEDVTVSSEGPGLAGPMGGLVGYAISFEGRIENCSTSGVVSGDKLVGGLVGFSYAQISLSHSSCSVTSKGGDYAGGLAGETGYNVFDSYSTGTVSGGQYVGGLSGCADNNVISCYSTANVSGTNYIGGLVGKSWGWCLLADCYARGTVEGTGYVGGIVGDLDSSTITSAYSTGLVTGGSYVGGLVGYKKIAGTVTFAFWDINTSGQTTSAGGTGKTTVQMKTKSTFTDASWDFNDIWAICETTNYPRLQWQIPAADWVCPDGLDFIDFVYFAERWLWMDCGDCGGADLTGDSIVDIADLAAFADNWLQ